MPTLVHEQKGLRIVKNEKNRFTVCTLHYTADPRKRTPEWKQEALSGLKPWQFDQEYEISYDAQFGEKIFPEIKERRAEIVVDEGPFMDNEWPHHLAMWGGFDYGSLNPSSFHVYTVYDKVLYAIWEMYEPCKNIFEFAAKMKSCPYWDQIRFIACDPDIYNLKMRDMSRGVMVSVASNFQALGISKFLPGNNDEQAWLSQMQRHWSSPEVTFKILTTCPRMIDELENATYVSMTDRQLDTQNYREKMVDKNNHAMDDLKYFMNTNPSLQTRKVRLPNLVSSYSPWNAQREKSLYDQMRIGE